MLVPFAPPPPLPSPPFVFHHSPAVQWRACRKGTRRVSGAWRTGPRRPRWRGGRQQAHPHQPSHPASGVAGRAPRKKPGRPGTPGGERGRAPGRRAGSRRPWWRGGETRAGARAREKGWMDGWMDGRLKKQRCRRGRCAFRCASHTFRPAGDARRPKGRVGRPLHAVRRSYPRGEVCVCESRERTTSFSAEKWASERQVQEEPLFVLPH